MAVRPGSAYQAPESAVPAARRRARRSGRRTVAGTATPAAHRKNRWPTRKAAFSCWVRGRVKCIVWDLAELRSDGFQSFAAPADCWQFGGECACTSKKSAVRRRINTSRLSRRSPSAPVRNCQSTVHGRAREGVSSVVWSMPEIASYNNGGAANLSRPAMPSTSNAGDQYGRSAGSSSPSLVSQPGSAVHGRHPRVRLPVRRSLTNNVPMPSDLDHRTTCWGEPARSAGGEM
jgi:hypothetical protein